MQPVNFLSKLNSSLSKQQQRDRKIFKLALIFFSISLFSFVVTLGCTFYLQFKLKSIKTQIPQATKQINTEKQVESNYIFFVNKLIIIKELFDKRADKQIAMGYFADLFGPDIRISGLNYNMEEGILSLTVTSPTVFSLENAFAALDNPEVTKNFSSLLKTNLNRNLQGEYRFDLIISFSEDSALVTVDKEYEE